MFDVESYTSRLADDTMAMFLLHGVIEREISDVRNFNRKHILKDELAALLKGLNDNGVALSVDEYVTIKRDGAKLPPKSFIITFDDGFENNYSVAAPVLADFNIPAIIYATTGFIDDNLMSWVDRIDYAVDQSEKSEITVSFIDGAYPIVNAEQKIEFLNVVRQCVKDDRGLFNRVDVLIDEIFEACDVENVVCNDTPLDKKMSWAQVTELDAQDLFTIGGHTHTHPIMAFLDDEALNDEIDVCLDKLEQNLAHRSHHFCYPEGLAHCYNDKVIEALKARGVVCSPSAIDGVNDLNEDLFHLKRIFVI